MTLASLPYKKWLKLAINCLNIWWLQKEKCKKMNFTNLTCPIFVYASTNRLVPKLNDTSTLDIFTCLLTYRITSQKKQFIYVQNFNCHIMTGNFRGRGLYWKYSPGYIVSGQYGLI